MVDFSDLDEMITSGRKAQAEPAAPAVLAPPAEGMYREPCKKCSGSGRWYGGTRAGHSRCFACNGRGFNEYRTSPEDRQKAKAGAERRKARAAEAIATQAQAWRDAHPVEAAWVDAAAGRGYGFAQSLKNALAKYGHLTEGQLAAATASAAADAQRAVTRAAEALARAEAAPQVSVAAIVAAFEVATRNGLKSPKLRLAEFKFNPAKSHSPNAGAVYVKRGETYLGKVMNGRFMRSRDCDAEDERRICEVASDPKAAAIAYGKEFGSCSTCGRQLTDPASIAMGIGPICAQKYGWA